MFVVRPRRLGEHRVAVVLPTNTWHAYNYRDVDQDGVGDTWYADRRIPSVDMSRPFLHGGVPRTTGTTTVASFTGSRFAARPRMSSRTTTSSAFEAATSSRGLRPLVFSGHEEYVTEHAYDIVERYRDLGGNLAFLSANNFFVRVERSEAEAPQNRPLARPRPA